MYSITLIPVVSYMRDLQAVGHAELIDGLPDPERILERASLWVDAIVMSGEPRSIFQPRERRPKIILDPFVCVIAI